MAPSPQKKTLRVRAILIVVITLLKLRSFQIRKMIYSFKMVSQQPNIIVNKLYFIIKFRIKAITFTGVLPSGQDNEERRGSGRGGSGRD